MKKNIFTFLVTIESNEMTHLFNLIPTEYLIYLKRYNDQL